MTKKRLEKPILADGEVTGHHHMLDDSSIAVFENEDGTREFELNESTVLTHEEHKLISIPEGEWISDKVEEYDHFKEEARKVQD